MNFMQIQPIDTVSEQLDVVKANVDAANLFWERSGNKYHSSKDANLEPNVADVNEWFNYTSEFYQLLLHVAYDHLKLQTQSCKQT